MRTTTDDRSTTNKILLLGAGELGQAIITSLVTHPGYLNRPTSLTIAIRPQSLASPSTAQQAQQAQWRTYPSTTLVGLDIETSSLATLTSFFKDFTTVIHAGGMQTSPGTVIKVAQAVLDARVPLYLPWQFGVDYDVIGPDAGDGLFREQCKVRALLRAQSTTAWRVISCGVFMSFLFEEFWGVVTKQDGRIRVKALGGWETPITTTTALDIGRAVAGVALESAERGAIGGGQVGGQNVTYIAGQTLTYGELADLLEKVTGGEVVREVWDLDDLRSALKKEPENKLWKYRIVFGEGKGVSWPVEGTWNDAKGLVFEGVEEWVRNNWTV